MLDSELKKLSELDEPLISTGRYLIERCEESIFPCDALALAALTRTFNLVRGFKLLIGGSNYECAASLLRLNLDNLLRLYGVTTCGDPHEIANEVLNGTALRKIKHSSGEPMTDAFLVKLLGLKNPWLNDAYQILSGFIHLSERHFQHLLLQSTQSNDGVRHFHITDEDAHVSEEQKANLVRMFVVVTNGTCTLIGQWADSRRTHGTAEQLKSKFTKSL